ncbi:putative L-aspartate dehydrogenase [Caerostris extrusa]|uniref:L-aspartate dehydrogenase n=1 Tax=Caerostris extrusa TaxID=172846 RepID=A0AAV4N266_CAEEX|nr:putative L-aspartate dehydrogenase [Caerostris extrusa]
MSSCHNKRRVGILGYGNLGKFLASKIIESNSYQLAFIWNRSNLCGKLDESVDSSFILSDINDFKTKKPDIIVEPTALSDENLLEELKAAATINGLYIPSGALWGGEDIRKMSDSGVLQSVTVTMKKHPLSLKLEGYLKEKNSHVKSEATVLYQGCVRDVCALAPHNTNTMAAAALAAQNLGFDGVTGCLVSDPSLVDYHIVEIEALGIPKDDGTCFHVHTIRKIQPSLELSLVTLLQQHFWQP